MKVCEICCGEIGTRDGDNKCTPCKKKANNKKRREAARARHAVLESCGLTRVRGALGGVYYE